MTAHHRQTAKIRRHRARRHARARRHVRSWASGPAPLPRVLRWYRRLLGPSAETTQVTQKVLRLVRHLYAHNPALCAPEHAPWLLLLARQSWLRPLVAWKAPPGGTPVKRDHLARHLLAWYPVPDFLFLGLEPARPHADGDAWAVPVLAAVGRGASLRALAGTDTLPSHRNLRIRRSAQATLAAAWSGPN